MKDMTADTRDTRNPALGVARCRSMAEAEPQGATVVGSEYKEELEKWLSVCKATIFQE